MAWSSFSPPMCPPLPISPRCHTREQVSLSLCPFVSLQFLPAVLQSPRTSLRTPPLPGTTMGIAVSHGCEGTGSWAKPEAAKQVPPALPLPQGLQPSFQEVAHGPFPGEDLLSAGKESGIMELREPPSQESASEAKRAELTHPTILQSSEEQSVVQVPAKDKEGENQPCGQVLDAPPSCAPKPDSGRSSPPLLPTSPCVREACTG